MNSRKICVLWVVLTTFIAVGLILGLIWVARAERRMTERLLADGCEVIATRTRTTIMLVGKVLIPHNRIVETWQCPDGRRFDR